MDAAARDPEIRSHPTFASTLSRDPDHWSAAPDEAGPRSRYRVPSEGQGTVARRWCPAREHTHNANYIRKNIAKVAFL